MRLVLAHPQKFRQREVRQRRIASELNQFLGADFSIQLFALPLGSNVAPDQCRPDNISVYIQHHRAMHLPREPDASDVFTRKPTLRNRLAHRDAGRAPPIFWMLLSPTDIQRSERLVLLRRRSDDATVRAKNQRASSSGSNVNPENVAGHSSDL